MWKGPRVQVLFVDDEPRVLDGLRRLLRQRRSVWGMRFANSGDEALRLLDEEPAQLLVTDMNMPEMDGAELLRRVRDSHPEVVRMILSGHSDREAALRAMPVAHQFLNKPCDATTLMEAIERAEQLHGLLQREALRRAVGQVDSLPSPPGVWLALNERLSDPDATVTEIAAIVRRDPAMSAKLLQMVNSSFVGLARHLSSIEETVTYLGVSTVRSLSLSVGAFRAFADSGRLGADLCDELSRHGTACAAMARNLVTDTAHRDDAFTASLLHNVGELVLASSMPDAFASNLEAARRDGVPLHEIEQAQGFTHAEVGAYLLGLWGLPAAVVDAVARHHETPQEGAPIGPTEATQLAHLQVQAETVAESGDATT